MDFKGLLYQVPGGMLSNLVSQLKEQKAMDKYTEVLEEIPKVREDLGEPPLVTPSSQIVGTQAVLNILSGERYKLISKETRGILRGEYGKTAVPFNDEVVRKAIGDEKPITIRPADLLSPEMESLEKEIAGFKEKEEDVLSYALFPQVASEYFKRREAKKAGLDPDKFDYKNKAYPI